METKLLGTYITNDLKWDKNTEYIVKKANTRIWTLRRLKALGASIPTLMDWFRLVIRSVLEFSAPLWTGSLTKANSDKIEKVQKTCFKLILGNNYKSYQNALEYLNENKLDERRKKLCLKFAKKSSINPKMSSLFQKRINRMTRKASRFVEPVTHSKRAYNGPIPSLIRLLNDEV